MKEFPQKPFCHAESNKNAENRSENEQEAEGGQIWRVDDVYLTSLHEISCEILS